jgi:hypothetical protein
LKCFQHNDRDTEITCISCGKYICEDCAQEFPQGRYCPHCTTKLLGIQIRPQEVKTPSRCCLAGCFFLCLMLFFLLISTYVSFKLGSQYVNKKFYVAKLKYGTEQSLLKEFTMLNKKPEDLPAFLFYPASKLVGAWPEKKENTLVYLTSKDGVKKVDEYYRKELEKNGWNGTSQAGLLRYFSKDRSREIEIYIYEDNFTKIILTYSESK